MIYLLSAIVVMAVVTYIIRALPITFFKKQLTSPWIKSFLYYIPYAVLGAMTFPAILYSTADMRSAICGLAAAALLAYSGRGLMPTAAGAVLTVYIAEFFLR